MRTTVTLDPDVERLLKKAMHERDATFKQVVNDSLRAALAAPPPVSKQRFRQLTFRMGRPRIDLTKATALAAEFEDQELVARLREGR